MECTLELEIIAAATFGLANAFIIYYITSFNPYKKKLQHLFSSFVLFVCVGSVLGLHIESECPMFYVSWGAITFAIIVFIFVKEFCVHGMHMFFREPQEPREPREPREPQPKLADVVKTAHVAKSVKSVKSVTDEKTAYKEDQPA